MRTKMDMGGLKKCSPKTILVTCINALKLDFSPVHHNHLLKSEKQASVIIIMVVLPREPGCCHLQLLCEKLKYQYGHKLLDP